MWVIDKDTIILSLPPHQENWFKEILEGIPCIQKRIGVDKWNQVLEDLCSMDITLPGFMGLFSHMQEGLNHVEGRSLVLTRGVHQAPSDFRWLSEDLSRRPPRLYELVPIKTTLDSYHDASRYMYGESVLLVPMEVLRTP